MTGAERARVAAIGAERSRPAPDARPSAGGERPAGDARPRRVVAERDGPLLVEGPVEVVLDDGRVVRGDRFLVALCTCRRSRRYPWCDTSHRRRARPSASETAFPSETASGTGSGSGTGTGTASGSGTGSGEGER